MAKFTLEEKRLQKLRTQLSGSRVVASNDPKRHSTRAHETAISIENPTSAVSADASFMRQDLFKIGILSCLALGIQFGIYFAMVSKLIPTF